jgi:hypothetical protein
MEQPSNKNIIRIDNLDAPIYRIFRLGHFREAIQNRELVLVPPNRWDDPFESLLTKCAISYQSQPQRPQEFFDKIRKPLYAQCWSMVQESDTLWRAYSRVVKDRASNRNIYPIDEGVQVRSTPRKLLNALMNWCTVNPPESCFLGCVKYMSRQEALQYIADEIGRGRLQAFPGGLGHAESVLFKRSAFSHEAEVRLIYVDHQQNQSQLGLLRIPIDPNDLLDEIIFDPRLATFERKEREDEAQKLGFSGSIGTSDLYQNVLLDIVIP